MFALQRPGRVQRGSGFPDHDQRSELVKGDIEQMRRARQQGGEGVGGGYVG
jgi:hypothetical protein